MSQSKCKTATSNNKNKPAIFKPVSNFYSGSEPSSSLWLMS